MPNRDFHLGIIGGCMSHQRHVPLSMLYHRQLSKKLLETAGIRLHVHFARDFADEHEQRLDTLLGSTALDGVLLHIRVALAEKAGLVVPRSTGGLTNYYLHPFLFRQHKFGWAQFETNGFRDCSLVAQRRSSGQSATYESPPPGTRIGRFRVRDLNRVLGALLRLDQWAVKDEMHSLQSFLKRCGSVRMPVVVLGPTPADSYWTRRVCSRMNQRLKSLLTAAGVPFCSVDRLTDETGRRLVQGDGVHLTVAGQGVVANLLCDTIEPWIRKVLENSTSGR
jgi:hypothetical protein